MGDEFSGYRVFVHVNEFFPHFLFAPHVEIVEAPLPKCEGNKMQIAAAIEAFQGMAKDVQGRKTGQIPHP